MYEREDEWDGCVMKTVDVCACLAARNIHFAAAADLARLALRMSV